MTLLKICGLALFAALFSLSMVQAENVEISSAGAPAAIGPYSQAVQAGNTIYLSGQIALNPETGTMVEEDIIKQTHQVFKNIQSVLGAAGYKLSDVVKSEVYLTDIENYGTFNKKYATYFQQSEPARVVVEVSRLPKDAMVEISMIAVK